jgi:hypothetical protein
MAGARRRSQPRGNRGPEPQQRERMRLECARIMAEESVQDYQVAKRKAGERLNLSARAVLPTNAEIEAALVDYLQLFYSEALRDRLKRRFAVALEAMRSLADFDPRLAGALLRGSVTEYSPVELHVFADTVEDVCLFLDELGVPSDLADKRLRFGGDRYQRQPVCRFTVDGIAVELVVFVPRSQKEPPLSPVDGRPMRRAGINEVQSLAAQAG